MSTEICETLASDCSDCAVGDSRAPLFDTRAPFEEWLLLLGAPESGHKVQQSNNGADAISLEAFAGSECEVTFAGVLRVDGQLKGNIRSADGTLVMTEKGRIEANVDVRVAIIDGHLEGNLRASEHVVLDRNAWVEGEIHTPSLAVRDGAVFEGHSFLLRKPATQG